MQAIPRNDANSSIDLMLLAEAKPSMFIDPIENRPANTIRPMKALRFSAMNRPTLSVRMMIASRIRPEITVKTLKKPEIVSDKTANAEQQRRKADDAVAILDPRQT